MNTLADLLPGILVSLIAGVLVGGVACYIWARPGKMLEELVKGFTTTSEQPGPGCGCGIVVAVPVGVLPALWLFENYPPAQNFWCVLVYVVGLASVVIGFLIIRRRRQQKLRDALDGRA